MPKGRMVADSAMKMVPVTSSNIAKIGYDADRRELRLEFKSGATHDHLAVPPAEYAALMSAESHGKYYASNIKKQYGSRKADNAAVHQPGANAAIPPTLDEAIRRYSNG